MYVKYVKLSRSQIGEIISSRLLHQFGVRYDQMFLLSSLCFQHWFFLWLVNIISSKDLIFDRPILSVLTKDLSIWQQTPHSLVWHQLSLWSENWFHWTGKTLWADLIKISCIANLFQKISVVSLHWGYLIAGSDISPSVTDTLSSLNICKYIHANCVYT